MRKRLTKPVLVGALAVAVSAIVAGPAFGGSLGPGFPQQGYPPSQHAQQSTFIPGYTDFPNFLRLQDETRVSSALGNGEFPNLRRLGGLLTPAERQQLDAVAAAARSDQQRSTSYIPGYTDFPNVLRLHGTLTPTERKQLDAAVARSNSKASFVPGFSDFPNVLRLHNKLTATERGQLDAAVAANSSVASSSGSDFSWSDAGVGIGIGLAIVGGLALVGFVGIRRSKATPVPA